MKKQSSKFGIYFHWPYCLKKCPYCDFNSYEKKRIPHDRITKAFIEEYDVAIGGLKSDKLESVYFGGGTPSLQKISNIAKILKHIQQDYSLDNVEITLEVNPATVDFGYLKDIKAVGVNRLSIGSQSFDDNVLEFLGRIHTANQAKETIKNARKAGFDNIGLDLIIGAAPSTLETLENDLAVINSFSPEHVSAYLLTIEPDTQFGLRTFRGECLVANESLCANQFDKCRKTLNQYGLKHYEISNFAKKGFRSRHNQLYWDGSEYIGVGPGAHSFVKKGRKYGKRYGNVISPELYMKNLSSNSSVQQFEEFPGLKETIIETVMTGLRRIDGLGEDEFSQRTGKTFDVLNNEKIALLSDKKMILFKERGNQKFLRLTSKGILFADDVILELV